MKASKEQNRAYRRVVSRAALAAPVTRNVALAFAVGGSICVVGQLVIIGLQALGLTGDTAVGGASSIMIVVGALLTGLGAYDELGRVGGMGAALPITGFANAIAAPAMEFRREGLILGVGARMFAVAGPVIVYGLLAAVAAAGVAWLFGVRSVGM